MRTMIFALIVALISTISWAQNVTHFRWTGEAPDPTVISGPFDPSSNCTAETPGTSISGVRVIQCFEDAGNVAQGQNNEGRKVVQFTEATHAEDAGGAYFSAWYYLETGFDDTSGIGPWRNNMQWKISGSSPSSCGGSDPICARCKTIIGFVRTDVVDHSKLQIAFGISDCGTAVINNAGVTTVDPCRWARTTPTQVPLDTWFHLEVFYKAAATNGAIKIWQDGELLFDISGANFNTLTRVSPCSFTPSTTDLFWTVGSYTCMNTSECTGVQQHKAYHDDLMITNFQVSSNPPAAPQAFLTAVPSTIIGGTGTQVDLSWDCEASDSASIDQGIGTVCSDSTSCAAGGVESLTGASIPSATTDYTLTCDGVGGSASDVERVSVTQSTSTTGRKRYTVFKAPTSPVIDGDLSEWKYANWLFIDGQVANNKARYALMWDETALYGAADVRDPDLGAILTSRDDPIYDEDSFELWLDTDYDFQSSPDAGDIKLIVSILNTQYDEVAGLSASNVVFTSDAVMDGTAGDSSDEDVGYTIEFLITWANLGASAPVPGTLWGMDLAMNDKRPATTVPGGGSYEKRIWANLDGGSPNNPPGWGEMIFSKRKPPRNVGIGRR